MSLILLTRVEGSRPLGAQSRPGHCEIRHSNPIRVSYLISPSCGLLWSGGSLQFSSVVDTRRPKETAGWS